MLTWTCVVAGWLLTLLSTVAAGRLAGLCVTAACGAAMAYFAMPPVFSFQVTEPADVATLGAYGVVGFVILRKGPARHSRFSGELSTQAPRTMPRTALSLALEDVLGSHVGARLRARRVELTAAVLPVVPGSQAEAARVLAEVLTAALDLPDLRGIAISAGRQPGVERIWVSAQTRRPPLNSAVTTGRTDAECDPFYGDNWPSFCRATWFDNGCDRIYQVSFLTAVV